MPCKDKACPYPLLSAGEERRASPAPTPEEMKSPLFPLSLSEEGKGAYPVKDMLPFYFPPSALHP